MAHPAVPDLVSFFYPMGNTPAVCLTRDIPREIPANILLLGCGDVRNVLYTCYVDHATSRPLDITCCDIQPAVIARNICLLSLVLENNDTNKNQSIWDIYYHLYIEKTSLALLSEHAKKLVALSETLQSWNSSDYGSLLRFCDSGTFSKVAQIWKEYAITEKKARGDFSAKLKSDIKKSANAKSDIIGNSSTSTGLRSASPAAMDITLELPELHLEYLKYGTTSGNQPKEANPMFNSNGTLHYAMDPLFGFHLAPAYVPLASSSLFKASAESKSTPKVVEIARLEFVTWCSNFKKYAKKIVLRFSSGDALAFCQTLQHVGQNKGGIVANCYRRQGSSDPLLLDSGDYDISGSAPTMFTAIDTSNLVDHLSALNVLMATSPLLENKIHATLFTEVLVRQEGTHLEAINSLTCGDSASMALLLGLTPVEYFTKATATSSTEETVRNAVTSGRNAFTPGKNQMLIRINWKRTLSTPNSAAVVPLSFNPSELASMLYKIYLDMFRHESASYILSSSKKSHMPHFHRGSFANLVQLVKSRASDDWDAIIDRLLALIEHDTTLIVGRNYLQELYSQLFVLGIYTTDQLKTPLKLRQTFGHATGVSTSNWKHLPPLVCVTMKVPRSKLSIFTDGPVWKVGVHTFNCSLTSAEGQWQNHYGVLQFSFGTAIPKGQRYESGFEINIKEDEQGWQGHSPLLVSFITPTWMFALRSQSPLVALCLQTSGESSMMFMSTLGMHLNVYQTSLADEENVFITENWPNLKSTLVPTGLSKLVLTSVSRNEDTASIKMAAQIDQQTKAITSLIGHADIVLDPVKAALQGGGEVKTEQKSPFQVTVIIAGKHRIYVDFPVPVVSANGRTRIARKSSYVEIIAPLLQTTNHDSFPGFMHPLLLEDGGPILWNMSRVDLDGMPIVDVTNHSKLKWLHTHISLAWSHREGAMRMASMRPGAPPATDVRVNYKDGLFTIFMTFSGARDSTQRSQKGRIFGLMNPGGGGVQVVIVASALRLDGPNGTVVLDAAAIPLASIVVSKVNSWITSLGPGKLVVIKVDEEELNLWKTLLPAYAERCRTWPHKPSCEYSRHGSIPVSLKSGESPLCSCGNGKFPTNFTQDPNNKKDLPGWGAIARYAVRVAISPSFSVPMVEKQVGADLLQPPVSNGQSAKKKTELEAMAKLLEGKDKMSTFAHAMMKMKQDQGSAFNEKEALRKGMDELMKIGKDGCSKCGKVKPDAGTALMRCARCHKTKYCSVECQKADWNDHKKGCRKE